MRTLAVVVAVVLTSSACLARETLREVSWTRLKQAGGLGAGTLLPADETAGFERLAIESQGGEPSTTTVLTIAKPPITSRSYAIAGQVRYDGVEGKGCLEMWSHFPGGKQRYSRTLGTGPMGPLEGSSGWRRFVLPFRTGQGGPPPEKLVVNVVLPGRGKVVLGRVALSQFEPGEDPLSVPGQWWDGRTAGLIGGGLGALLGLLGAVIGCLASLGRGQGFVLAALRVMLVLGLASLAAGIVAVVQTQPYAVYYPLLLLGVLCAVLPLGLLRVVRRRYQELELRQMAAEDIA